MSRVEVAAGGLDQICGTLSARAKQVALTFAREKAWLRFFVLFESGAPKRMKMRTGASAS